MFSDSDKDSLNKINQILDVKSELNQLLSDIKLNLSDSYSTFKKYVKNANIELGKREESLTNKIKFFDNRFQDNDEAIKKLYEEKSKGFPWLAEAYTDYSYLNDMKIRDWLENKSHPAKITAKALQQIAQEKREVEKKYRITKCLIEMYESLFPWICEYVGEDLNELLLSLSSEEEANGEEKDPVLHYVPKVEYEKLTEENRNQKALDRYQNSRGKKPWQIGRDYERYIGYLYEQQGYKVQYEGIEKGLEDLGRDLICRKGSQIEIVQCKCWANYKTIHEKHINQLYGTTVKFYIDQVNTEGNKKEMNLFHNKFNSGNINATFITSTKLSETAMRFAQALGINIVQEKLLQKYPMIKCNITGDGEKINKIYHLPFDQQYDNTQITKKGEFYASTVKEAMDHGFRRAYHWKGNRE